MASLSDIALEAVYTLEDEGGLAVVAAYVESEGVQSRDVPVLPSFGDAAFSASEFGGDFGGSATLNVRRSDIAVVPRTATFAVNGQLYKVHGEAMLDERGGLAQEWTVTLKPVSEG